MITRKLMAVAFVSLLGSSLFALGGCAQEENAGVDGTPGTQDTGADEATAEAEQPLCTSSYPYDPNTSTNYGALNTACNADDNFSTTSPDGSYVSDACASTWRVRATVGAPHGFFFGTAHYADALSAITNSTMCTTAYVQVTLFGKRISDGAWVDLAPGASGGTVSGVWNGTSCSIADAQVSAPEATGYSAIQANGKAFQGRGAGTVKVKVDLHHTHFFGC